MESLFASAANYQEAKIKQNEQKFTMENNALARLIDQSRRNREEDLKEAEEARKQVELDRQRKEAADFSEMERFLQSAAVMLQEVGRPIEGWYINPGGEVITVYRETESVRVQIGNLSSRQMRWIALRKVIAAVIG